MNNPYKILGVSANSTDEEILKAYRKLVKKYHPDNYTDSSMLDYATKKMQEINIAYSFIKKERAKNKNSYASVKNTSPHNTKNNYTASKHYTYQNDYYKYYTSVPTNDKKYNKARCSINKGNLSRAENILNKIKMDKRNAEWYYLKGRIFFEKDEIQKAYNFFKEACRLNPENREYQKEMETMQLILKYPQRKYSKKRNISDTESLFNICRIVLLVIAVLFWVIFKFM